MSFQVRKSFKTKTIEMYRRERKCLHHYLYLIDPEFGFMHIRHPRLDPLGLPDLHQRPRAPRGAMNTSRDERAPPPGCRSGPVKLRAA